MRVEDGPVLVENVYVADNMLCKSVRDWRHWAGVLKSNQLNNEYAKLLFELSSPLPETYRENINNHGYSLQGGAALFSQAAIVISSGWLLSPRQQPN